jgi:hypothetical protein
LFSAKKEVFDRIRALPKKITIDFRLNEAQQIALEAIDNSLY